MENVDISELDPAILAIIPLQFPPPGVKSNFENPESRSIILAVTIYATLPPMVIFLLLRIIARIRVRNSFGADDYLCILAALCIAAHCGVNLSSLDKPGGGLMGIHSYDTPLSLLTPRFFQSLVAIIELYMAGSMLVKLSFLMLYLRLFKPVRRVKWLVWTGTVVITVGYVAFMAAELGVCVPRSGDRGGWVSTQMLIRCNKPQMDLNNAQAVFSAISDAYVLFIPLHLVPKLRLSLEKKIAVGGVFLTGLLSCCACIICAYYRFQKGGDHKWDYIPALAAGVVELNIGVICACMPVTFVLFKQHAKKMAAPFASWSRDRRTPKNTTGSTQSTEDLRENHLPSIPGATMKSLRSFIGYKSSGRSLARTTRNEMETVNDDYHAQLRSHMNVQEDLEAAHEGGMRRVYFKGSS